MFSTNICIHFSKKELDRGLKGGI